VFVGELYRQGQRYCMVVVADSIRGVRVLLGSTVIGFDVCVRAR